MRDGWKQFKALQLQPWFYQPTLTEHLSLETKYFSSFRTLHSLQVTLSCFQLTLILRSVCKTKAHWYQLGESEQVQTADKQTQAQQSLLFPASSLILSGPNLLSHALCQIPASRTGTGFSTQHNVLCKVTTSRLT